MEGLVPAAYNPHLQRVLKSFQSAAEGSLSGPSRFMAVWNGANGDTSCRTAPMDGTTTVIPAKTTQDLNEIKKAILSLSKKPPGGLGSGCGVDNSGENSPPTPNTPGFFPAGTFPVPHMGPLLLPMDTSHSEKSETDLQGDTISCFIVGGEKRLCLPQILNSVLKDFSLQQINAICDDLHIFCSRCNHQQLDLLKMTGTLPPSAPSCGLITKTDAERLCNSLLHGTPEKSREPPTRNSFKVYHECFGKCKGVFSPEMYSGPESKCIECCDCCGVFCPQKFVCHSHKAMENRTCHWGFDSANWRAYLLLAKDQDSQDGLQRALDDLKDKFDMNSSYKKRRETSTPGKDGESTKRARFEENGEKAYELAWNEFQRGMSAFRPWSPSLISMIKEGKIPAPGRDGLSQLLPSYLQTGPPVLLNPERVVPFNESKRYDRHFAPNVSLAPQPAGKDEEGMESIDCDDQVLYKVDPKLLSSISNYSTSSSVSRLSSPSPIKVERNPELELSSSDESSFRSESVPTTPRDDYRHLVDMSVMSEEELKRDREQLLVVVQHAMEAGTNRASLANSEHDRILEEAAEFWARHEEKIRQLVQTRKHLLQENEQLKISKKERLQEMSESRLALRHDVERLLAKSQESATQVQRLQQELEFMKAVKNPEVTRVKAKYKGQIEVLRGRLVEYEKLNITMASQVNTLRLQLKELGHSLPDSLSGHHKGAALSEYPVNGSMKHDEDVEMKPSTRNLGKSGELMAETHGKKRLLRALQEGQGHEDGSSTQNGDT